MSENKTILIDTNVIKHIARGSVPMAEALKTRLKSKTPVYIPQPSFNELVDSPAPLGEQYRALLKDLAIEIAPHPVLFPVKGKPPNPAAQISLKERIDFHNKNIQHEPKEIKKGFPEPGQITEYGGKRGPGGEKTRPGDAFVAAEAMSLDALLWTADQDFAKRAKNLGVDVAPESQIRGVSGTEDVDLARRLLGVETKKPPSGGGGSMPPTRSMPEMRLRGLFRHVGRAAVGILSGFVFSYLRSKLIDEPAANDQMEHRIIPEIARELKKKLNILLTASIQRSGKTPYANVEIETSVIQVVKRMPSPFDQSPPLIYLKSVQVSDTNINTPGHARFDHKLLNLTTTFPSTFSFPISMPPQDVDWYRKHVAAHDAIHVALANPKVSSAERQRLMAMKERLSIELDVWLLTYYPPFS